MLALPKQQRYLHGPGTGITNLPSFSATKFSELLDELPLPSFFSTLMTSFFVGFSGRQTFPPPGDSIGVAAFFTSSGVRLTSSIVEIFSPASPRLHHFVKLEGLRVGALRVKKRRESGGIFSFHCCFVFVCERFFLRGCARHDARGDRKQQCASYCKDFH